MIAGFDIIGHDRRHGFYLCPINAGEEQVPASIRHCSISSTTIRALRTRSSGISRRFAALAPIARMRASSLTASEGTTGSFEKVAVTITSAPSQASVADLAS